MVRRLARFIVVLTLIAFSASTSFSQQVPRETEKPASNGPRKQLATILFAGLGGAVLGLSTLSFYGRPQDKLENIAIGFAVGVIAGTSYVTYKAATAPSEFYGSQSQLERYMLHLSKRQMQPEPLVASMTFDF